MISIAETKAVEEKMPIGRRSKHDILRKRYGPTPERKLKKRFDLAVGKESKRLAMPAFQTRALLFSLLTKPNALSGYRNLPAPNAHCVECFF